MYAFSVWEPRKKEPQDETVDLIKKLLKRKDLTLPEQRIAGAILECLQSYPRLLLEMAMADELNEEGQ